MKCGVNCVGEYLKIGIVHKIGFSADDINNSVTSIDVLREGLRQHLDMSLFSIREAEGETQFVICEEIVKSQLHDFLSQQFSLYSHGDAVLLERVRDCLQAVQQNGNTLQSLIDLAENKEFPNFQSSVIYSNFVVSPIKRIRYKVSMFSFFIEGKIFMEEYLDFLKYAETLIRKASSSLSISGAVRAFIQ